MAGRPPNTRRSRDYAKRRENQGYSHPWYGGIGATLRSVSWTTGPLIERGHCKHKRSTVFTTIQYMVVPRKSYLEPSNLPLAIHGLGRWVTFGSSWPLSSTRWTPTPLSSFLVPTAACARWTVCCLQRRLFSPIRYVHKRELQFQRARD